MPYFRRRSPEWLEAWAYQPGFVIDRVPDCDPETLPSEINRHGKAYPVRPGDYVYKDTEGLWDACPKDHFESQYMSDEEPSEYALKEELRIARDALERISRGEFEFPATMADDALIRMSVVE